MSIVSYQLAKKFTEDCYPQFINRFDRIWEKLTKRSSDFKGDDFYLPNFVDNFAFSDEVDIELNQYIILISIFTDSKNNLKDFSEGLNKICLKINTSDDITGKIAEFIKDFDESQNVNVFVDNSIQKEEKEQKYLIWTRYGKFVKESNEIEIMKTGNDLFIDGDKGFVYNKGHRIVEIAKWPQAYKILKCIAKNKGSATPRQILDAIYPDTKISKKSSTIKKVSPPVSRLRKILLKYGLYLNTLGVSTYELEESITFALTRRNINV